MPRDPLEIVLRIRRVTVDDAKRSLAIALAAEDAARCLADAADALIDRESEAATDLAASDATVEAFAAWLPVGRLKAEAARAAYEAAGSGVVLQRAALTAARAASEAAEAMLDRRRLERTMVTARREQAAMDEVGARTAATEPNAGDPPLP